MAKQKRKDCTVDGCPDRHYAKGYCQKHYVQVKKFGRLTPESEHHKDVIFLSDVAEDKPVEVVKVKPARLLHLTPAQLVKSGSDVFWRWNRENPIGWPRAEKSRLKVGK